MLSQGLLDRVLRQEHKDAGLYLIETEDFLFLKKKGKVLATFSAVGATIESIQHEADQILNWDRSGITFEKGAE